MTFLCLDDPARGDVPIATMVFPDGQPHVSVDVERLRTALATNRPIEIVTSVKSAARVVDIALVTDAVRSLRDAEGSTSDINLTITYLLGARMDRRIAPGQPATLHVLASMLRPALVDVRTLRILDPHSPVTREVLPAAEVLVPDALVGVALEDIAARAGRKPVIVIPDQGAVARTSAILARIGGAHDIARCIKKRDSRTGALSGFGLEDGDVRERDCLIVDDICDGGGTFSGIAGVLREHGARTVSLLVTHGVFSRGIEIPGIDTTYCTDSYVAPAPDGYETSRDGKLVVHARDGVARLRVWPDFVRDLLRA